MSRSPRTEHTRQDVDPRRRALPRVLLVALILSVTLGPRIRLGLLEDRAIDLRIQDLLIVPALVLARPVGSRSGLRAMWSWWCTALSWTAVAITTLTAIIEAEPGVLARLAYLGRGLEPFLVAVVVCRLVVALGPGTRTPLRTLQVAVVANLAWVGYQAHSGTIGTLLGSEVGNQLSAYGPKLVGEGSAFGTGAFFAAAAALAVAQYRTRTGPRALSIATLAAASIATYLSQSRIWLGAIAVFVVLLVLRPGLRWKTTRALLMTAATAGILIMFPPTLPSAGRLSGSGVDASFAVRMDSIWQPLLERMGADPIAVVTGLGAGGLLATGITEAHNIALRALVDYGPVGALLLFALFGRILIASWVAARDDTMPSEVRLWAEFTNLVTIGVLVGGAVQDSFTAVTSSHIAMLAVGVFAGMATLHRPVDRDAAAEVQRRSHAQS
jgi:hypothetical protein